VTETNQNAGLCGKSGYCISAITDVIRCLKRPGSPSISPAGGM